MYLAVLFLQSGKVKWNNFFIELFLVFVKISQYKIIKIIKMINILVSWFLLPSEYLEEVSSNSSYLFFALPKEVNSYPIYVPKMMLHFVHQILEINSRYYI